MRTWVMKALVVGSALLGGVALADSPLPGERIDKSFGPVDATVHGATRGPGAADIQPEHRVVPPQAGPPAWGSATDHGHTPTNEELAQGATPSIGELPPVPRTLEYMPEGAKTAGHGAGHK